MEAKMMTQEEILSARITPCGCGKHTIDIIGDESVFTKKGWWRLSCLCKKSDLRIPLLVEKYEKAQCDAVAARKEVENLQRTIKDYKRLRDIVGKTKCFSCGQPVGKNWTIIGDGLLCTHCSHETGGEG